MKKPSVVSRLLKLLICLGDRFFSPWMLQRLEFYENGVYNLSEKEESFASRLIDPYASWAEKYPLLSIEDGLDENDWDGWAQITERLGNKMQLVEMISL